MPFPPPHTGEGVGSKPYHLGVRGLHKPTDFFWGHSSPPPSSAGAVVSPLQMHSMPGIVCKTRAHTALVRIEIGRPIRHHSLRRLSLPPDILLLGSDKPKTHELYGRAQIIYASIVHAPRAIRVIQRRKKNNRRRNDKRRSLHTTRARKQGR